MISLLYPIRNRKTLFSVTINSILKYSHGIKNEFEIIVLDSGSNDGIKEYVDSLQGNIDIRYIQYTHPNIPQTHNPAYAFNLGSKLAKYSSIVLTSPEIRHKTDVIKQLLFRTGKNVLCKIFDEDRENKQKVLLSSNFRNNNPGYYFIGMYNKADYHSIGGIDEKFMTGVSCEDVDFGDRFIRAGLKYEIADDIIGIHSFHERIKRTDKGYIINKRIWDYNNTNKVITVNKDIRMGNLEYRKLYK